MTFRLTTINGKLGITCFFCGLTSFHPQDVAELYCGHCHIYHIHELMKAVFTQRAATRSTG